MQLNNECVFQDQEILIIRAFGPRKKVRSNPMYLKRIFINVDCTIIYFNFTYFVGAVKTLTLTLDDIMNLERSTEYKEEEIKKWFK